MGAKLDRFELVWRRAGLERQQNQRVFGRGGGDRNHHPLCEANGAWPAERLTAMKLELSEFCPRTTPYLRLVETGSRR